MRAYLRVSYTCILYFACFHLVPQGNMDAQTASAVSILQQIIGMSKHVRTKVDEQSTGGHFEEAEPDEAICTYIFLSKNVEVVHEVL